MKKGILLALLVVFVFFTHYISAQEQPQTGNKWNGDPDEYNIDWERAPNGIVEGQIIDPDTGKPVDELFWVVFHDIKFIDLERSRSNLKFKVLSDENGFFSRKLLPAQYYVTLHYYIEGESFPGYGEDIKAYPFKKYCADPVPWKNPETAQIITIEKGKVTQIIKHPVIGGDVKFLVVDNLGQKIDFKSFFKDLIVVELANDKYPIYYGSGSDLDSEILSTGTVLFKNVPPGEHHAIFYTLGPIGRTVLSNIIVEKRKMSEYTFEIDFSTGIEGIIVDSSNNPIKSVELSLKEVLDSKLDYMKKWPESFRKTIIAQSDNNGKFRFVNLFEGHYKIDYSVTINNIFYTGDKSDIVVRGGQFTNEKIIIKSN